MKTLFAFLFLVAVAVCAAWFAHRDLAYWGVREQVVEGEKVIQIPRGTSLTTLSGLLAEQGLVSSSLRFKLWVRFFSDYSGFQAGQYRFVGQVSPQSIASMIRRGEVWRPVALEITIPEGFRLAQIVDRFVQLGVGTREEFESYVGNASFLGELGIEASSLEGYFYPATYRFYERPSVEQVLREGVKVFFEKLPDQYVAQVKEKGLTLHEAVTFASLIELETKHDDERSLVSEVIWRRLNNKTTLGIDAAIIYGIKDFDGNLRRTHLNDPSNLYNSRIHPGLPPTPIGSPSRESLAAVLTPTNEGYYYYVVDAEQGDRHHFSKDLREHNQWVRKLVRAQADARRAERAKEREQAKELSRQRRLERQEERELERTERQARRERKREEWDKKRAQVEESSSDSTVNDENEYDPEDLRDEPQEDIGPSL